MTKMAVKYRRLKHSDRRDVPLAVVFLVGQVLKGDNKVEEDSFDMAIEMLFTRRVVG